MNVMSQKEYISLLSRHLFWDMDVNKVNLDTCPAQIIQRVLEYGNLKDWQLILSYYGLDRIVSICQSLRTLDKKALSYISRVETGKTEPKVSTFYRIASALGLNVELTPAM